MRGGRVERFEYEGHPVPGFRVQRSVRKGLLIPGAILLGSAWLLSGFSSTSLSSVGFIPLVGSFVVAGQLGAINGSGFAGGLGSIAIALFVTAGLVQLGGAALMVAGLAVPQLWLERDVGDVQLALVPTPSGAQLIGRF